MANVFQSIKSDLTRYAKPGFRTFLVNYFYNQGFNYSFWFRLAHSSSRSLNLFAKVRLKFLIWKTGIDIPPGTKIGYGFYIGHAQSIVVSPLTTIGNNCNISQFVSIGSNHGVGATIGNNVYIGPNVCIVEDVKIGNRVTIGAGAVVSRDIPDDATVAGVPAKVLNFNKPGRYISNIYA
ncbi:MULTISPECIES: serine O-acetyltransferase [unclassified Shewanella]|uniref:serine O-acetyltransferase n=1 Tax=unclassified Shewanella TaxID=196818 RepID=UPI001568116C|nr:MULTISPECIES: serine O-acetyltransferase [unclassified Shewanella]MCU8088313.1 serine O-acetyltransferase [Shewanella sp. SM21]